jgi:type II secretory pathway pseudopilin PulG
MTIAEVLIASSILLVCLTSLAGLLGGSITSSRSATMRDEAANLANLRIEAARSLAYDRVGVHYANGVWGDPQGDILTPESVGPFVVTTNCTWVRTSTGRAAYKKLSVVVSWQQPTQSQIEVTTMIYGKSALAVSGDLEMRLRYREDNSFVQNATVAIAASDGSQRAVSSDASGVAFFGQVALGAVNTVLTPPAGCVVDTSTLSNVVVAADAVSTIIVYIQRPAQTTVAVSDTQGAPIVGATVSLRRSDGLVLPSIVTGADGNAVFTQLLYGDYSASVSKSGYSQVTLPVSVTIGSPSPILPASISQLLGAGLHIRVFDTNGAQLPGETVTVRAHGSGTVLQTGVAASNGEISFSGLVAGNYDVTVDKASYVSQTSSDMVHDGDVDFMDFQLVPAVAQGNLQITSRDKHGNLKGLRLIVSGPSGYYHNDLYTSSSYGQVGQLTLGNLIAGSYTVKTYDNAASTVTVIVNGGQTAYASVSQK